MTVPVRPDRDERSIPPADLWDLKVKEGLSPDSATKYVASIHGPPPAAPRDATVARLRPASTHSFADDLVGGASAIGQGMSGGLMDELAALEAGFVANPLHPLKHFEKLRQQASESEAKFAANHPVGDVAGQVAGTLLGGALSGGVTEALAGPRAVTLAAGKAPLLTRAAKAGKDIATAGGIGAGVGFASGNGGVGERLESAKQGAEFGAGLSAGAKAGGALVRATGIPALVRAITPRPATEASATARVLKATGVPLASHERMAAQDLLADFDRSGLTIDDYLARAKANPDHPLYDLGPSLPQTTGSALIRRDPSGDPLVRRARGVQSIPSRGSAQISDFTNTRAEARPARLADELARGIGVQRGNLADIRAARPVDAAGLLEQGLATPRENVVDLAASLKGQRAAAANPKYAEAYAAEAIDDPEIQAAFKDKHFAAAYRTGRRIAAKEGVKLPPLARNAPASLPHPMERGDLLDALDEYARAGRGGPLPGKWFHGSNQTFDTFDPAKRGSVFADEASKKAFFFTSDPSEAQFFANEAARRTKTGKASVTARDITLERPKIVTDDDLSRANEDWLRDLERRDPAEAEFQRATGAYQEAGPNGISPGFERLLNEHLSDSRYDGVVYRGPENTWVVVKDPKAIGAAPSPTRQGISVQGLDYAKQGLDDLIESRMASGKMGRREARALRQKLNGMLERVDEQRPEYAEARRAFREGSQAMEGADAGAEFLRTSGDELSARWPLMTDAAKENYRKTALAQIQDKLASGANPETLLSDATVQKLRTIAADPHAIDQTIGTIRARGAAQRFNFFGQTGDEIERLWRTLPDAERQQVRQTALAQIQDRMSSGARPAQLLDETTRRKLRTIAASPADYNAMELAIRRQMQGAANDATIMGGSPTARIMAEQADLGGVGQVGGSVRAITSPSALLSRIAESGVANRLRGMTEARVDALAPYLTAKGPELEPRLLFLKALQEEFARAAEKSRLRGSRVAGQIGGRAGATP